MKKVFSTLLLATTLCLSACQASYSYDSIKNKLDDSFSVSHVTLDSIKTVFTIPEGVTLSDALYGSNDTTKEKIQAIFFASTDDCSKFIDYKEGEYQTNLIKLINIKEGFEKDGGEAVFGSRNNVAYVASIDVARKTGLYTLN